MISGGMNLVMTVIGFTVSIMFIVFICTRLICARIQLRASRRSFFVSSRSDLSMLERGTHGLEPVVVANFPTKNFCEECFSANKDAQCPVCLSEYRCEDTLRILPYCGHSFHVTCIDIWLQQHSTCPVCRVSLREFPEKKRLMQPLFSSSIRSHFGLESFDTHAYNCLLRGQGFSLRTRDNPAMEQIQENSFASVGRNGNPEAGETMSRTNETMKTPLKSRERSLWNALQTLELSLFVDCKGLLVVKGLVSLCFFLVGYCKYFESLVVFV
ncbi:E3 ubiquitin-protein ligase ATL4-like [Hibiscus syriacus]|uniref:E3 ubiquitin-protein ligase ATL4-like n=1 Tax=Hibiscus syriacus TaxID=106335 RepID=UPI001925039D|nr:E3 ubiquitin-protein ligase ATL4-like [Hibiscus syriacus]